MFKIFHNKHLTGWLYFSVPKFYSRGLYFLYTSRKEDPGISFLFHQPTLFLFSLYRLQYIGQWIYLWYLVFKAELKSGSESSQLAQSMGRKESSSYWDSPVMPWPLPFLQSFLSKPYIYFSRVCIIRNFPIFSNKHGWLLPISPVFIYSSHEIYIFPCSYGWVPWLICTIFATGVLSAVLLCWNELLYFVLYFVFCLELYFYLHQF